MELQNRKRRPQSASSGVVGRGSTNLLAPISSWELNLPILEETIAMMKGYLQVDKVEISFSENG